MPGEFLGIVGQDPSDSKSNRLHVDIFGFCLYSFEVYSSINSFKMFGNSPQVANFNRLLFLELNQLSTTNRRSSPDLGPHTLKSILKRKSKWQGKVDTQIYMVEPQPWPLLGACVGTVVSSLDNTKLPHMDQKLREGM